MAHRYTFENSEEIIKGACGFKEKALWLAMEFLQDSLPNKRPVKITIEEI